MLDVKDIWAILDRYPVTPEKEIVPLVKADGRFLFNDTFATLDSPPFDKAAMDGWAVIEDESFSELDVIETVAAGDVPASSLSSGKCAAIMTGAKIPQGTGKIIRVEYSRRAGNRVFIEKEEPLVNIIRQGENLKKGDTVLTPRMLGPGDIGILASLGLAEIPVAVAPSIGIITTGSELKEPGESLRDGQIYNSNGHQLKAQAERCGCPVNYYGIIPDDEDHLYRTIEKALKESDILILSGGVSMGEFDFVPSTLGKLGVKEIFYKAAIKPGRPLWFGGSDECSVFGLPGNPVSTYILFEVFVKHLIYRYCGQIYSPDYLNGFLGKTIKRRTWDRTEFLPVYFQDGKVYPVRYHGSSHLNAMALAHGLLTVEKGTQTVKEGEAVHVRLL